MSRREDGYAIVAAVAALAVLATVAYALLAADRGSIDELRGQYDNARLEAAAQAGLAEAIQGVGIEDSTRRWPIDGRAQSMLFEGLRLTISVEDERGKLPMDGLTNAQLRRLFAGAGASGGQLDTLVESFQDWVEPGDDPRPDGAKAAYYRPQGIHPRYDAPVTVDELARLRGMSAPVLAKLRPALTTFFGASGEFSPETSTPLAIAVHDAGEDPTGAGEDIGASDDRQPAIESEHTALEISNEGSRAGRSLTVVVRASDGRGEQLVRRTVVQLTGRAAPAYYIRAED
jgi:general secretion pathway protein K